MKPTFLIATVSALILGSSATFSPSDVTITTTITKSHTVCPCDTTTFPHSFPSSSKSIISQTTSPSTVASSAPGSSNCGVVGNTSDNPSAVAYQKFGADCQQFCQSNDAESFTYTTAFCFCYENPVAKIVSTSAVGNTYYDIDCQFSGSTSVTTTTTMSNADGSSTTTETPTTVGAGSPIITINPGTNCGAIGDIQDGVTYLGVPYLLGDGQMTPDICLNYCQVNNPGTQTYAIEYTASCYCYAQVFASVYAPADPDTISDAFAIYDVGCSV